MNRINRTLIPLFTIAWSTLICPANSQDQTSLIGRWNLQVQATGGSHPSWLEVRKSGNHALVGSFVGQFGSARPISKVDFDGQYFRFAIPAQWEKRTDDLVFLGQAHGETLSGTTTDETGRVLHWKGSRAPKLIRQQQPVWGRSISLFDQKTLHGWVPRSGDVPNGWSVNDGILENRRPGNDLITEETFTDFRLDAEFRYPKGSNSGIYLRGRYEMQIEDNYGEDPDRLKIGGIYGFLTPSTNAAKPAGEWQSVEITLVGRVVTVVFNGKRVIDRQRIPGPTGGALDNAEGAPGPIMLQGDHGPIEFRRLTLTKPE